MLKLCVHIKNEQRRFTFPEGASISFGRALKRDVVLSDVSVSRKHAVIRWDASRGRFLLEDKDSNNGTYVDGQRLTGSRELCGGEHVRFGAIRVDVEQVPGAPPAAQSVPHTSAPTRPEVMLSWEDPADEEVRFTQQLAPWMRPLKIGASQDAQLKLHESVAQWDEAIVAWNGATRGYQLKTERGEIIDLSEGSEFHVGSCLFTVWETSSGASTHPSRFSCAERFDFVCPMTWSGFRVTSRRDRRHCQRCHRDVHLAEGRAAFERLASEGHCVALPQGQEEYRSVDASGATRIVYRRELPRMSGMIPPPSTD